MAKKLTKGQKAWATRRANLAKASAPMTIKDYAESQMPVTVYSLSKALDNSLDKLEQRLAAYIERVERILA